MAEREFDPLHLEVSAFAKLAGRLEGSWPLSVLERLTEATAPGTAAGAARVAWSLAGERRAVAGEQQVWLHLRATTTLPLVCQRCLGVVEVPVEAERAFLFVHGEQAAAALDAEIDDDVLALTRSLDARELLEDELLLALPLVSRHEVCPEPLPLVAADPLEDEGAPNPFEALAALQRPGRLN